METVVFDLDGTLADITIRRNELNNLLIKGVSNSKAYNWFFSNEAIALDKPNEHVLELFRLLQAYSNKKIIILSGRPFKQRHASLNFIDTHISKKPVEFVCRQYGDTKQTDYSFKKLWISNFYRSGGKIQYAFDDQIQIVKLWREFGITCFDCAGYVREN